MSKERIDYVELDLGKLKLSPSLALLSLRSFAVDSGDWGKMTSSDWAPVVAPAPASGETDGNDWLSLSLEEWRKEVWGTDWDDLAEEVGDVGWGNSWVTVSTSA